MLGVGHGIEDALDDSLLTDYIHDFACMHLMNTEYMAKEQQAQLLRRILELHAPAQPLAHLAAVHSRYWECESRITLHLQLLDALKGEAATAAVSAVLALLERDAEAFAEGLRAG